MLLSLTACALSVSKVAAAPPNKPPTVDLLGAKAQRRWFGAPGVTRYGGRLSWHYAWLDWGFDAVGGAAPAKPRADVVGACGGHLGHSWFRLKVPGSVLLLHSLARAGALGLKPGAKTHHSGPAGVSPYVGFSTLLQVALNVHPGLNVTVDNELSLQRPLGENPAQAAVDRLFWGSALTFRPGVPFL